MKPNENREIYSKNQTKTFPDAKQLAEAVNIYINKGQFLSLPFAPKFSGASHLSLINPWFRWHR